jgi:hypothetical protein
MQRNQGRRSLLNLVDGAQQEGACAWALIFCGSQLAGPEHRDTPAIEIAILSDSGSLGGAHFHLTWPSRMRFRIKPKEEAITYVQNYLFLGRINKRRVNAVDVARNHRTA